MGTFGERTLSRIKRTKREGGSFGKKEDSYAETTGGTNWRGIFENGFRFQLQEPTKETQMIQ